MILDWEIEPTLGIRGRFASEWYQSLKSSTECGRREMKEIV
jgi:hypothetical protein